MNYQLPELLSVSSSLASFSSSSSANVDDDSGDGDGDLHINSGYTPDLPRSFKESLLSSSSSGPTQDPPPTSSSSPSSRLRRRAEMLLREYNPGLLASVLVPFNYLPTNSDINSVRGQPPPLELATEWLAVSALVNEEVLRPGRIIDFGLSSIKSGEGTLMERCAAKMHSPPTPSVMKDFMSALNDVPTRPTSTSNAPTSPSVQEYIAWRSKISGLRVLFDQYFSSSSQRTKFERCVILVVEICACVTDLFAYNIHQAYHSPPSSPASSSPLKTNTNKNKNTTKNKNENRGHLNIISFLLTSDPDMTLQGAINCTGELIRSRIAKLKVALTETQSCTETQTQTRLGGKTGMEGSAKSMSLGGLSLFTSSFISSFPSFSFGGGGGGGGGSSSISSSPSPEKKPPTALTPATTANDQVPSTNTDADADADVDVIHDNHIRKLLINWVNGTIHWAYEVDYFYPELVEDTEIGDGDVASSTSGSASARGRGEGKRKGGRGSEVRDYGWVFLIRDS